MPHDRGAAPPAPRPPAVFLGTLEVAGYYASLAVGLRALGVPVTYVDLGAHAFRYDAPRQPRLAVRIGALTRRRMATRGRAARAALLAVEGAARVALMAWAVARHRYFVFGYATTFLGRPALELRLLRLLGKRIVYVFHGSDSRPPYLDGATMAPDRGRTEDDCVALTRAHRARVEVIDRWAHHVVENPLDAHFHTRPLVSWFAVGVPVAAGESAPAPGAPAPGAPVRLLHCPSHPAAKGTDAIRAVVARLQGRGLPVKYVEITGRPNHEVLAAIDACDLVLDQLYSDTPLASFATEAAQRGKPVLVGGYGADHLARVAPPGSLPPSAYVHPDAFEATLERLVQDADARRALAAELRTFVATHWAPERVAARMMRLLSGGDVPAAWQFAPASVVYCGGCALPASRARALVRGVLERGGPDALCVSDKPALRAALVRFAETGLLPGPTGAAAEATGAAAPAALAPVLPMAAVGC